MQVHLINPSHLAFGVGVITPRWLYVLAAATPPEEGFPAPYLYKIIVQNDQITFLGMQGNTKIQVPINQ